MNSNFLNYQYRFGNSFISRTDYIKDRGVRIDSKIHCHLHVDFIFPHALKILWLIRRLPFSFSVTDRQSTDAVFCSGYM